MTNIGNLLAQHSRDAVKRFHELIAVAWDATLETGTTHLGTLRFNLGHGMTHDWFYVVAVGAPGAMPQVITALRREDLPAAWQQCFPESDTNRGGDGR